MRIDVITLFPDMVEAVARYGVTGRAAEQGLIEFGVWNPRDYTRDRHKTVDDRSYGGGPGMVMMVEPLRDAIHAAKNVSEHESGHVVYLSPQGRTLDQAGVSELLQHEHLVLVAGRYEGVDERLIDAEVDSEWSIGDYVMSGGELAAMVMADVLIRQVPGALGHEDSAEQDSFANGILDYPHYTRPEEFEGRVVPEVLLSGDHAAIERWRQQQALGRTWLRRPELLEKIQLDEEQQKLLQEFIHMHEQN